MAKRSALMDIILDMKQAIGDIDSDTLKAMAILTTRAINKVRIASVI